jgi:hypothetical protein
MSARHAAAVMLTALSVGSSGCAVLLVGAGAVGGYAISKDSVRNVFDASRESLYDKSLAVVESMGAVKLADRTHGLIKADVQDVNVTVTIKPLTKKTVELKVKGRSDFFLPKVDVAQEIYTKIVEGL